MNRQGAKDAKLPYPFFVFLAPSWFALSDRPSGLYGLTAEESKVVEGGASGTRNNEKDERRERGVSSLAPFAFQNPASSLIPHLL